MQTDHSVISDAELLALLDTDPERAMEMLVEQYTPLLCHVASGLLSQPEDVQDCVSETFSEFYLHFDRFDPEKGSLKGYLAVIARRCAIRIYNENRRQAGAIPEKPQSDDPLENFADREALEAALASLNPVDEQIIRMKYFGGMRAKEIAAALDIPYETVKKRHQRSLKKLHKALTIGLMVALILAALAGCAYLVLRYFGVVPGYGVNTNMEAPIYVLEEPAVLETEGYTFTVRDGYWDDGLLLLKTELRYGETSAEPQAAGLEQLQLSLTLEEPEGFRVEGKKHVIWQPADDCERGEILYSCTFLEKVGDTLELRLLGAASPMTLRLCRAEEIPYDQAGAFAMTENEGGLLALPRLEDGNLILSIYPLSEGEFTIDPGLVKSICGQMEPITVTAEDGTVLTGQPVNYRPFGSETYFDWDFGPAQPGAYTLTVPYVFERLAEDRGEVSFTLRVPDREEATVEYPGGSMVLHGMEPLDYTAFGDENELTRFLQELSAGISWWTVDTQWLADDPERVPVTMSVSCSNIGSIEGTFNGETVSTPDRDVSLENRTVTDPETGLSWQEMDHLRLGCNEGVTELEVTMTTSSILYRWKHPFTFDFEVTE